MFSGAAVMELSTSFSMRDQLFAATVSSEPVSCSLTACVKVSKTSVMSLCRRSSSASRRPNGVEHAIVCRVTHTAGTRTSLNSHEPPCSSSLSIARISLSAQDASDIIIIRCGVGPKGPCNRQGGSNTEVNFWRTLIKVSIPSALNSVITAWFHFRSFC